MKNILKYVKVGIVLPEDQQTSLQLSFSNTENYYIEKSENISINNEIEINVIRGQIFVEGNSYNDFLIRLKRDIQESTSFINVSPVTAGRGFHWQKKISAKYSGDIKIKIKDGYLLVINYVSIEEYLKSVVVSEMSENCPPAFVEAQMIAARSWFLASVEEKHLELGIDVCNDDCCQRYQGKRSLPNHFTQLMDNTAGKVLMYNNEICDARYSKSCGGMTESFENVWNESPHKYLNNHPDIQPHTKSKMLPIDIEQNAEKWITSSPQSFCSFKTVPEKDIPTYLGKVDKHKSYYRWDITYSQHDISTLLSNKLNILAKVILDIVPLKRGGSSRIILLEIKYLDNNDKMIKVRVKSEYEIRRILHHNFLFSSAIIIKKRNLKNGIPEAFDIFGAGWGHGVGLCQIGALGMALKNYSSEDILNHYYPGTKIEQLY